MKILALIVAVLALSPAAQAQERHPFPGQPIPVGDGVGVVAWQVGGTAFVLADGQSAARAIAVPDPSCALKGIGAGQLLYECADFAAGPVVQDAVTGAARRPAPTSAAAFLGMHGANGGGPLVDGIGSRLVRVRYDSNKGSSTAYLDWHADRLVVPRRGEPSMLETLAEPTARRRICAPVRVGTHRTLGYIDVITVNDFAAMVKPWTVRTHAGRVMLQRCGSPRTRVVARGVGVRPLLTRRYVAWQRKRSVTVLGLVGGARRTWPLPGSAQLLATNDRLFVRAVSGDRPATAYWLDLTGLR